MNSGELKSICGPAHYRFSGSIGNNNNLVTSTNIGRQTLSFGGREGRLSFHHNQRPIGAP
jgi:hypothetical protein